MVASQEAPANIIQTQAGCADDVRNSTSGDQDRDFAEDDARPNSDDNSNNDDPSGTSSDSEGTDLDEYQIGSFVVADDETGSEASQI